jgi:hypothetical protein
VVRQSSPPPDDSTHLVRAPYPVVLGKPPLGVQCSSEPQGHCQTLAFAQPCARPCARPAGAYSAGGSRSSGASSAREARASSR